MNAFKDFAGHVGNAADALFLGGAARTTRHRNAFADMINQGDFQGAQEFAASKGANNALGQATFLRQQAEQEQQALAAQEAEAEARQMRFGTAALDALMSAQGEGRAELYQALMPRAVEMGFDEAELAEIGQNLSNDLYLRTMRNDFGGLTLDEAIDNRVNQQNADTNRFKAGTGRYNAITNRDQGQADQALKRDRLALDRDAEERQQRALDFKIDSFDAEADATAKRDAVVAERLLKDRFAQIEIINSNIDKAIDQSKSGVLGVLGSNTGATFGRNWFATNLDGTIDQIRASIGFDRLEEMRRNSPTGGALGQVTEKEIKFLQSVLGSLSTAQGENQLDANLTAAKRAINESFQRMRDAYIEDFGQDPGVGGQSEDDIDALINRYAD